MCAWFRRAVAVTLTALLSLGSAAAAGADGALTEGDQFPSFSLQRSDGSEWRLADHAGKPKLVMFWATWCPYCRKLMPGIAGLHEEFEGRGLEVVAVNFRDDGDTDAYAREMGLDFDIVLDGDALAAQAGVTGTPTVFVLDGDDRVMLRTTTSDPDSPSLRDAVESLLPPDTAGISDPRVGVFRSSQPYPSRYPIYSWPNELPIAGEPVRNVAVVEAVGEWLRSSNTPKLLQYAAPGAFILPGAAQWMAENYPNLEAQFVGYGAHYIQEDNPRAPGNWPGDRRLVPPDLLSTHRAAQNAQLIRTPNVRGRLGPKWWAGRMPLSATVRS